MPDQNAQSNTPLRARIPLWMAQGLEEVARKKRVDNVSLVTRWALEDYLKQEGITAPGDNTATPAAA